MQKTTYKNAREISIDERDILVKDANGLIEVVEIHTHGHLVEVLLVTSETYLTDDNEATHYIVTAGHIGDSSNVSHIGDNYSFDPSTQKCWCYDLDEASAQNDALDHAWSIAREVAMKIDSI